MRKSFFQALFIFIALLAPAIALWLRLQHRHTGKSGDRDDAAESMRPVLEGTPDSMKSEQNGEMIAAEFATDGFWNPLFDELAGAITPIQRAARLEKWWERLNDLPQEESTRWLQALLDSGRNRETGLRFTLNADGLLQFAPTVRTWAIDALLRLDPEAAHHLAVVELGGLKDSADEFALHLRNYVRGAPEDAELDSVRRFIAEKSLELIRHQPWADAPSVGYLEAYDVIVWAEVTEATPELMDQISPNPEKPLRQAANLALDRLVIRHPAGTLTEVSRNLHSLDSMPRSRAGYFARARLDSSDQAALVETYFLNEDISASERDYFLELLPNLNLSVSYALLTEPDTISHREAISRFEAARDQLRVWTKDPRFRPWLDPIEASLDRIESVLARKSAE